MARLENIKIALIKGVKGDTGYPTDEQMTEQITNFMNEHPEMATDIPTVRAATKEWLDAHPDIEVQGTVEDGSITPAKLDRAYAEKSHTHSATDITSGTLDKQRLPKGVLISQTVWTNDDSGMEFDNLTIDLISSVDLAQTVEIDFCYSVDDTAYQQTLTIPKNSGYAGINAWVLFQYYLPSTNNNFGLVGRRVWLNDMQITFSNAYQKRADVKTVTELTTHAIPLEVRIIRRAENDYLDD